MCVVDVDQRQDALLLVRQSRYLNSSATHDCVCRARVVSTVEQLRLTPVIEQHTQRILAIGAQAVPVYVFLTILIARVGA